MFDDPFSMNVPRLRLSLRIEGDTLDPDFLTQQLGVTPSFTATKGAPDARGGRNAPHETGIWTYRLEVPPDTELGDAIGMLLNVLPDDTTLWEELASTFRLQVFVGVFLQADNQSTLLDAEVLAALGRRGWTISFDLYGPFASRRELGE